MTVIPNADLPCEETIILLDSTKSPFDDEEVTQEIPVETMREVVYSERPTVRLRPLKRAKSPTEYSISNPTREQP